MATEVTKEEAEEILAKARHKEITDTLKALAIQLGKTNNKEVVAAILNQSNSINSFAEAITSLPIPQVHVNVNNEKVISTLTSVGAVLIQSQIEILAELRILNAPKHCKLKVHRENRDGYITEVEGTINHLKPKAQA